MSLFKFTRFALAASAVAMIAACGGTGSTSVATAAAGNVALTTSASNLAQTAAVLAGASVAVPAGALGNANAALTLTFGADGKTFTATSAAGGAPMKGVFRTGSCIFTPTENPTAGFSIGVDVTVNPCVVTITTTGQQSGTSPLKASITFGAAAPVVVSTGLNVTIDPSTGAVSVGGTTLGTVSLQATGATGATR